MLLKILPLLALILTGTAFKYSKLLPEYTGTALIQFVFYVCIPGLLILNLAAHPIYELLNYRFMVAFCGGSLLVFFLMFFYYCQISKISLEQATLKAMLGCFSNAGFIALPILYSILGNKGAVPAIIATVLVSIVILPVQNYLFEKAKLIHEGRKPNLIAIFFQIITNPVFFYCIIGILFSIFQIPIPKLLHNYLNFFILALTPCALFAIGFEINIGEFLNDPKEILSLCFIKLIVLPCIVLLLCKLLNVSPLLAFCAVVISAVPTAKTPLFMANRYHLPTTTAAGCISISAILSIITFSGWLTFAEHLFLK